METKFTFTIAIPTYNHAPFLRETLQSVLNQEVAPDRILVSNNHSTDNTAAILDEFKHDFKGRIEVVVPPQHCPMMENWAFLVSHIQEDWFTLFSSDDVAYPNFVRVLREGIAGHEKAVLVRAGWNTINARSEVLGPHRLLSVKPVLAPPDTLYENKHGPKTSFAAFAVKTAAVREAGGISTQLKLVGDWALWVSLSPLGEFIYQDEIISGYRVMDDEVHRNRHAALMGENAIVFGDLIPKAAKRCGLKDTAWIKKAARENLLNALASLSVETPPELRSIFHTEMAPWARLVGESDTLDRFAAGETIRHFNLAQTSRRLLRPLVEKLKS